MIGELTPRQLEVLQLAARGKSVEETARSLWVAAQTVKYHRKAILQKFDAPNIQAAIWKALELGILDPPNVLPVPTCPACGRPIIYPASQ